MWLYSGFGAARSTKMSWNEADRLKERANFVTAGILFRILCIHFFCISYPLLELLHTCVLLDQSMTSIYIPSTCSYDILFLSSSLKYIKVWYWRRHRISHFDCKSTQQHYPSASNVMHPWLNSGLYYCPLELSYFAYPYGKRWTRPKDHNHPHTTYIVPPSLINNDSL